jgi:DNA-binding response OmpR family regulator
VNIDQIKIAIIEDEIPIQMMYRLKLEREGFTVETANNGREGLRLIKYFRPQLVLLDLRMPVMSGDEMLAQMRSTSWGADISVVVLTNISRNEAPHALRFLHVDSYIVKAQFTPTQVVSHVRQVLSTLSSHKES